MSPSDGGQTNPAGSQPNDDREMECQPGGRTDAARWAPLVDRGQPRGAEAVLTTALNSTRPRPRQRLWLSAAAVFLVVVGVVAVTVGRGGGSKVATADGDLPDASTVLNDGGFVTPSTPCTDFETGAGVVEFYAVCVDGYRTVMFPVRRGGSRELSLQESLDRLPKGLTPKEEARGLRTGVTQGQAIKVLSNERGKVMVEIEGPDPFIAPVYDEPTPLDWQTTNSVLRPGADVLVSDSVIISNLFGGDTDLNTVDFTAVCANGSMCGTIADRQSWPMEMTSVFGALVYDDCTIEDALNDPGRCTADGLLKGATSEAIVATAAAASARVIRSGPGAYDEPILRAPQDGIEAGSIIIRSQLEVDSDDGATWTLVDAGDGMKGWANTANLVDQ